MVVLTKDVILSKIRKNRIKIEPFNEANIGPASMDLTLGNEFRVFKSHIKEHFVTDEAAAERITKEVIIPDHETISIKPGELILGITREKITLPNNICGWLQGRSRFARLGLMVHITASLMQPGISNRQVLELYNASKVTLRIPPGIKICQFVFEECKGNAKYSGRYKEQIIP